MSAADSPQELPTTLSEAEPTPPAGPPGLRIVVTVALVSTLVYLGFVLLPGSGEVWAALESIRSPAIALTLSLTSMGYLLRFLRWQFFLKNLGWRIRVNRHLPIYLAGFAYAPTPGKAGEVVRSVFLKRQGVPYADSVSAFVAERLLDLAVIAGLGTLVIVTVPTYGWLGLLGLLAVLGALAAAVSERVQRVAFLIIERLAPLSLNAKLMRLRVMAARVRELLGRRTFIATFFLGLTAWLVEAIGFVVILQALGSDLSTVTVVSVYCAALLIGALSFLPGGIGSTEAAMTLMLSAAGLPLPIAVVATLIGRALTLWFGVAVGVCALLGVTRASRRWVAE